MKLPLARVADGCRLKCRVTPKSSRNGVDGLYEDAAGKISLKARVTAAPEKGKANAALIKLIAGETGLAASTIAVIAGEQSRHKTLLIKGEPSKLEASLTAWLRTYYERSDTH